MLKHTGLYCCFLTTTMNCGVNLKRFFKSRIYYKNPPFYFRLTPCFSMVKKISIRPSVLQYTSQNPFTITKNLCVLSG